jgi:ribosomal protein S18 acetylase RimI-like enzyme
MNDVIIRKAQMSDIPYIYEICLKTGEAGKDAEELYFDPYLIGNYYAAPYFFFSESICFVAEYQCRPQGYIIAVPDTTAFEKWMEEQWLPPLRKRYPQPFPQGLIRSEKEAGLIKTVHNKMFPLEKYYEDLYKDYPAHLHIDMLPALQGKGLGRKLMDSLFKELNRQGIKGLHLGVSAENTSAILFYQKLGFSILKEHDWGFTMAKQLGQSAF